MELLESKSLLAKLMATENITIEQSNVRTASFNPTTRVLVVPILDKNISGNLYDLFMGHEVGHALYTTKENLKDTFDAKIPSSIANVVEDARIERKIKHKYPGLRNSFVKGYRDLLEKDFFGTKGVDLNTLNFIDRGNLYFKGGPGQGIKFNEIETQFIHEIDTTETYADVLDVSKRITDYMRAVAEEEKRKRIALGEPDEDDSDAEDEWEFKDEFDVEDGEYDNSDEADELNPDEEENDEDKSSSGHGSGVEDEIKSFTDEAYKQNEDKLFVDDNRKYIYVDIPKIIIDNTIVDYKKLYNRYKNEYSSTKNTENFQKFRKETGRIVSYLAKEFEMRKNAQQMKRASTAKTGELDMSKIFSYRFSEDIFKKLTVVPNGKSHGLVMFLDWSGSMADHLYNTVKQLLSLALFCRKVNIPFEVYSFVEGTYNYSYKENLPTTDMVAGELQVRDFYLANILSSRMSAAELTHAGSSLMFMGLNPRYCPSFMRLGGTPLNEAVISAMEVVPEFQKKYKLQIVNTVFLTDGDGHRLSNYYAKNNEGELYTESTATISERTAVIVVRDKVTKHTETIHENYNSSKHTEAYIKLLKARTGCNVVGFYILSTRELKNVLYRFNSAISNNNHVRDQFRSNKYLVTTNAGFDEYYLLKSDKREEEGEKKFEVSEKVTTRGLISAFSKYTSGRLANKVVLNRFIGMIS